MRILLTGASGFTGRHFSDQATAAGHQVIHLTANLTDPSSLHHEVNALGSVDAVVHLAAISFVGHDCNEEIYTVNTVGTTHLLSALSLLPVTSRPRKVLIASSANVYGNSASSPIGEHSPPAPINHYAASKLAMEFMALTFTDRLPIVITRPFNYTGPGQSKSFLIPKVVDHFVREAPLIELGNLHVEREFNDVRVLTDIYLRLLSKGEDGEIYNVCSGKTYSLLDVISILETLTGHSLDIQINPNLVRANEVHRLCGDPSKLISCIGNIEQISLQDCISNMLDTHRI